MQCVGAICVVVVHCGGRVRAVNVCKCSESAKVRNCEILTVQCVFITCCAVNVCAAGGGCYC